MTRVCVRFLPGVPLTRGPGLGDADLWAIKDIQARLSLEKWERAAAPKSCQVSGAACAHFPAAHGKAARLCQLLPPLGRVPRPRGPFPALFVGLYGLL